MIIYVIRYQKVLTTCFLFQYLTNYISLKIRTNGNIKRRRALLWDARASTFSVRSHKDPFAFVTALPRSSDPKIRMKCYLILRKLHRTHKIFLKIILSPDHLFGIVVSTSDCLPRGPRFDSQLYPRNFSRSIGSGTGSTQPEANWVAA